MNLLPTEFYAYSITVPDKGSVAYDTLKLYKYTALEAERDEFSRTKGTSWFKVACKSFADGIV